MASVRHTYFLAALLAGGACLARAGDARAADPGPDALFGDGVVIFAGGTPGSEMDAIPIFASDVELEAVLLMVRRHGLAAATRAPDAALLREARRAALTTRLLARQAREFDEVADPAAKAALEEDLAARAGGKAALLGLLAGIGLDEEALRAWCERSLLAATQVRYAEEQIDYPSEREIDARMAAEAGPGGGPRKGEALRERCVEKMLAERRAAAVERWLTSLLASSRVRIVR